MNLFAPRKNLSNYTSPVVRMVVCILCIITMLFRNYIISISNGIINFLISFFCVVLFFIDILYLYKSVAEIAFIHEGRQKQKEREKCLTRELPTKSYLVSEIISMLTQNNIIEITVKVGQEIMDIGASSDCNYATGVFFDKAYYIEKNQYQSVEEFKIALLNRISSEEVSVISIDGVGCKYL